MPSVMKAQVAPPSELVSTPLRLRQSTPAYRTEGSAGSTAIEYTQFAARPVWDHVAPPSVLLNTPPMTLPPVPAYTVWGAVGSTASAWIQRVPSASIRVHVRPASTVLNAPLADPA